MVLLLCTAPLGCVELLEDIEITRSPRGIVIDQPGAEIFVGDTIRLSASVFDQHGAPFEELPGERNIKWSVSDTTTLELAGDLTDPFAIFVLGSRAGLASVSAALGGLDVKIHVRVFNAPDHILITGGEDQEGTVGEAVPDSLHVQVLDVNRDPVAGFQVVFQAAEGSGSVSPDTTITDEDGFAATAWTVGTVAGEQTVSVKVRDLDPVIITALAVPGPPATLELTPTFLTLDALGDTTRVEALVQDSFGNHIADPELGWLSADTTIATVDTAGLITARSRGEVTVSAVADDAEGSTTVFVDPTVTQAVIEPDSVRFEAVGDTLRFSATAYDRNDNLLDDAVFEWSTGDPAIVEIDSAGVATARGAGATVIMVKAEAGADTAHVLVKQVAAYLVLEPQVDTLRAIGGTTQLTAQVSDRNQHPIPDPPVQWTSLNDTVAGVDSQGLVTGYRAGQVGIVAGVDAAADTALITIRQVVASIDITPSSETLAVGGTVQLTAQAADSGGHPIPDPTFAWGSLDPAIASVDDHGLVTGVSPGSTSILAVSDGVEGTAGITVEGVLRPVQRLSVGGGHTCAAGDDGNTYCWGANDNGQLGTGDYGRLHNRYTPAPVDFSELFRGVAGGNRHTCALAADGTAYCWGDNRRGQLGIGFTNGPELCDGNGCSTTPVEVVRGTFVLSATPVRSGSNGPLRFSAVTTGNNHSCGITTEGTAYCWGDNDYGQLGNGDAWTTEPSPVQVVGDHNWWILSAGGYHTCGITDEGKAYCWGEGWDGQLGTGVPYYEVPEMEPAPVAGDHHWSTISAGSRHTCGITDDDTAYCWGSNSSGSLGDGTDTSAPEPVEVTGGHVFQHISANSYYTCGVTSGGTGYCWGSNSWGQLGDGSNENRLAPTPVAGGLSFTMIDGGDSHSCGVTSDGSIACWGRASNIGDGSEPYTTEPVQVMGGHSFTAHGTASNHACGVTAYETAYCWGSNWNGQLGDGTTTNREAPTPVAGGISFRSVVGGLSHGCGIAADGRGYCWGDNGSGQLGDGTNNPSLTPVEITGDHRWAVLSAISWRTCGVTTDGDAYCWGSGNPGWGFGNVWNASTPIKVADEHDWATIHAGGSHSCGVTTAGDAYCWGRNWYGELGDSTQTNRNLPTLVAGGHSFVTAQPRTDATCGLTTTGEALCWGRNESGALGDGTDINLSTTPGPVAGGHSFVELSSHRNHTCAITDAGETYCWGNNYRGQLGAETPGEEFSNVPIRAGAGHLFSAIDVSGNFTCALDAGGGAWCWGYRNIQLGDGSRELRDEPVLVPGLSVSNH